MQVFNAGLISSLTDLRNRQGIKATYDFVTNSPDVYGYDSHGTAVLSVLAGKSEGMIEICHRCRLSSPEN